MSSSQSITDSSVKILYCFKRWLSTAECLFDTGGSDIRKDVYKRQPQEDAAVRPQTQRCLQTGCSPIPGAPAQTRKSEYSTPPSYFAHFPSYEQESSLQIYDFLPQNISRVMSERLFLNIIGKKACYYVSSYFPSRFCPLSGHFCCQRRIWRQPGSAFLEADPCGQWDMQPMPGHIPAVRQSP